MVFFETPNDGAVFAVGSITWFGSLSYNTYDNPVSRITDNVAGIRLRRLAGTVSANEGTTRAMSDIPALARQACDEIAAVFTAATTTPRTAFATRSSGPAASPATASVARG